MRRVFPVVPVSLFLGLVATAAVAGSDGNADPGRFHWLVNLRLEVVDADGFDGRARATTGRFLLGYETRSWNHLTAMIELEAVEALDERSYNSTANGETGRPVIVDPEDSEINQAYVTYRGPAKTVVRLGRQRIKLDNDRFIGNVGWRQNEQTFDALSVSSTPLERLSLFGAALNNANRIFGEHHPDPARGDLALTAELFNASWRFAAGKLVGYGYWLEFDDTPAASTRTFGLRFSGATACKCGLKFSYTGEWADQGPHAAGDAANDADYVVVQAGLGKGEWSGALGLEQLGGDGVYAFQTPLATLHAFNGWTDQFLTTPPEGLQDLNAHVAWKKGKQAARLVYHDFTADAGSADYGNEWGLLYTRKLSERLQTGAKLAHYNADDFGVDTDKVWVWLRIAGGD